MEGEVESVGKSAGRSVPYRTLTLPEDIMPTSAEVINALNEYMVQLLQVCFWLLHHVIIQTSCKVHNIETSTVDVQELKTKEESIEQLGSSLEEFKRKFAVIRHQQGLLYKEYQRYVKHVYCIYSLFRIIRYYITLCVLL